MTVHGLLTTLVMTVATLLTIDLKLPGGTVDGSGDLTEARTAGFTVLVLAQLFNCLNSRSERDTAVRGLFVNPLLWAAITLSLILQLAVLQVPVLNQAFDTTPLSAANWALCVAMASSVVWVDELRKLIERRASSRRAPEKAAAP